MHRYLLNAQDNQIVDHINGIKHDNRKKNIRITSYSVNNHNRRKKALKLINNKWTGEIVKDGIRYYLPCFETLNEAVQCYNAKAIALYGKEDH